MFGANLVQISGFDTKAKVLKKKRLIKNQIIWVLKKHCFWNKTCLKGTFLGNMFYNKYVEDLQAHFIKA